MKRSPPRERYVTGRRRAGHNLRTRPEIQDRDQKAKEERKRDIEEKERECEGANVPKPQGAGGVENDEEQACVKQLCVYAPKRN